MIGRIRIRASIERGHAQRKYPLCMFPYERVYGGEAVNYAEYGSENGKVVMLLHGGGLSTWNYRKTAELLSGEYRVIIPVLDGHAGSDADFTTIEDNAARIIEFIDEKFGGNVLLMGGLSLGGQILLEIMARRRDVCRYALIESALVVPSKLTCALAGPMLECSYGLIRRRWFAKLQFASLGIRKDLFEDYYRDTCGISKENMISFLRANALYSMKKSVCDSCAKTDIFVGGKENRAMRKSAGIIHETLPGSRLHTLPGWRHGEFSINHPAEYAGRILEILSEN